MSVEIQAHTLLYIISTNKGGSMGETKVYKSSGLDPTIFDNAVKHMLSNWWVSRDRMKEDYFEFNIRVRGKELLNSHIFEKYKLDAVTLYSEFCRNHEIKIEYYPFKDLPKSDRIQWITRAINSWDE